MASRFLGPILISAALVGAGVLVGLWLEPTPPDAPARPGSSVDAALVAGPGEDDAPGRAADGTLVDEPSDPFIAGVAVDRLRNAPIPSASLRVRLDGGARSELRVADTDSEGTFRIAGLSPDTYTATFEHSDYFPVRLQVTLEEGRPVRDLVVALEPGSSVRGRIVPGGAEVAGVTAAWMRWEGPDGPAGIREVATDREGAFELGGLHPGRHQVEILPAGLRLAWDRGTIHEVTLGPGENRVDLSADLGRSLSIRVFDVAGTPAGGLEVTYRLTATGGRGVAGVLPATDPAEGETALRGLPGRGSLELRVAGGERGTARLCRSIASLPPEVDLLLSPGIVLAGTVVLPGGRAAESARVAAARNGGGIEQVVGTDGDGGFQLVGLVPGTWQIRVVDAATGVAAIEEVEITSAAAPDLVRTSLGTATAVLGRVVGPGGGPVSGARVRLRAKDREEETICGADGAFAFAARPREECRVIASRGDGGDQTTSVTAVAGVFVEIALPRPR